jgi:hypothetical protein
MDQDISERQRSYQPRPETIETKPAAAPLMTPAERPALYYTSPPSSSSSDFPAKSRWRLAALSVLVAVGLGIGGWYAISALSAPKEPITAALASQNEKVFKVSKADLDGKATESLKALLTAGASSSSAADGLNAVNAHSLLAFARSSPQLSEEIKTGRRVLYRVHLIDVLKEDGDQVELSVDDLNYGPVYLTNAGKEILIPMISGTPSKIKVTATADGGGGVTFGMISSLGEARTRVLQVGESENWQVTIQ